MKLHVSYIELLGDSLFDLLNLGDKKRVDLMEDKFGKVVQPLCYHECCIVYFSVQELVLQISNAMAAQLLILYKQMSSEPNFFLQHSASGVPLLTEFAI